MRADFGDNEEVYRLRKNISCKIQSIKKHLKDLRKMTD